MTSSHHNKENNVTHQSTTSFRVRLLSALVLIPLVIVSTLLGGASFFFLIVMFMTLMFYEWIRLSDQQAKLKTYLLLPGFAVLVLLGGVFGIWPYPFLLAFLAALLAFFEALPRHKALCAFFGMLYILIPCLALLWLRGLGPYPVFFLFCVVYANDTGAYLGGSRLKGPLLWPRVSKNKTWSGLICGLFMGTAAGALFAFVLKENIILLTVLAFCITLSAVAGDLLESALKRFFGVKDTGGLIPGHGGVLDRLDSLMIAVLILTGILVLWGYRF